jgi:nicotinamide mononucleotide adenylyltransferase
MDKGIFVGRLQPLHNGHVQQIRSMIDEFGSNSSLVVIGSIQEHGTEKNPFPYRLRYRWVSTLFPMVNVLGMPDFVNDDEGWLNYLQDLMRLLWGDGKITPIVHVGSNEDAAIYHGIGLKTKVMPRGNDFYCGTKIRECLTNGDNISGLVPAEIKESVRDAFTHYSVARRLYQRRTA